MICARCEHEMEIDYLEAEYIEKKYVNGEIVYYAVFCQHWECFECETTCYEIIEIPIDWNKMETSEISWNKNMDYIPEDERVCDNCMYKHMPYETCCRKISDEPFPEERTCDYWEKED